jgi:hypothetical protein
MVDELIALVTLLGGVGALVCYVFWLRHQLEG